MRIIDDSVLTDKQVANRPDSSKRKHLFSWPDKIINNPVVINKKFISGDFPKNTAKEGIKENIKERES